MNKLKMNNSKILYTFDDQFLTSAAKFDRHIATTDFVTKPNPTSSFNSSVSKLKLN